MFDPPFDAPLLLVALAVASTACFGAASALAPAPPGNADALAATVDAVAASPIATATTHPVAADAVRLGPRRVTTETGGRRATATYATSPVTPVTPDTALARVLAGAPPGTVFDAPADLAAAAAAARARSPRWHHEPTRIRVRRIIWRDTRVTLVSV